MARPSRPSVRFTPLDMARIMNSAQTQNSTGPIDQPKSSTKESRSEAGVLPAELGNWSESTARRDADDQLSGHLRLGSADPANAA